ncbi:MAG: hypothetical protein PHX51_03715 [Clostridia bacterium]|nr:hypothetical protein [Clostridia bacterium]
MIKSKDKLIAMVLFVCLLTVVSLVLNLYSTTSRRVYAEESMKYVKELRVSSSGSSSGASDYLSNNGYSVVDGDLNANTGKDFVYLGYKSTSERADAIHSIKLLSSTNGVYTSKYATVSNTVMYIRENSLEAYEQLSEEDAANNKVIPYKYENGDPGAFSDLEDVAKWILDAVNNFKANYIGNSPFAKSAYEILNTMCINDIVYQPTTEGEKVLLGDYLINGTYQWYDLLPIFTECGGEMSSGLYEVLLVGQRSINEDSFLTKMSKGVIASNNITDEEWNAYASVFVTWFDMISQFCMENSAFYLFGAICDELATYSYGDATLREFFMQAAHNEDEVKAVIKTLNKYELELLLVANPVITLLNATVDDVSKLALEYSDFEGNYNFWAYSDRDMYTKEISLTAAAAKKQQRDAVAGRDFWKTDIIVQSSLGALIAVTLTVMSITYFVSKSLTTKATTLAQTSLDDALRGAFTMKNGGGSLLYKNAVASAEKASVMLKTATRVSNVAKVLSVVGKVVIVVAVVAMVVLLVYSLVQYYKNELPNYDDMPNIVYDEVYYEGNPHLVKYTLVNGANIDSKKSADLNGGGAPTWNALYTSTSEYAGDPINTNIQIKGGSGVDNNMRGVSFFGENKSGSTNSGVLTTSKGCYISYGYYCDHRGTSFTTTSTEHEFVCNKCGETVHEEHYSSNTITLIEATETSEGYEMGTCDACGAVYGKTTPKLAPTSGTIFVGAAGWILLPLALIIGGAIGALIGIYALKKKKAKAQE